MGRPSPCSRKSGLFRAPFWNWLQENNLTVISDCTFSEYLNNTWQAMLWIIIMFSLLLGTCAFWKRALQSIKKILIFINLVFLLYQKGADLFQDVAFHNVRRKLNTCSSPGNNNNMLVSLSLQEKILKKLQLVEGKVKDLEELILTYKGSKKKCTRPYCDCLDCKSRMATSGITCSES